MRLDVALDSLIDYVWVMWHRVNEANRNENQGADGSKGTG